MWQQPLDITINEHEQVWFVAPGTFDIYLTGNYVLPPDMDDDENDEDDEMDYNVVPGEEDDFEDVADSEEDELDGLEDPRITEVDSEEEEAPKLVEGKKGKNKRPADSEDDSSTLDAMIAKNKEAATNGEKLSKKQAKKLKKNDGQAVAAAQDTPKKEAPSSDKKKVQFAKNLELGPTGSPKVEEAKKAEPKKDAAKAGPRNVGGVIIDDKKIGKGRAAKKGDRIEMRYIGKLKNGKQFDGE
jgi:FK506-binding nuclear protein